MIKRYEPYDKSAGFFEVPGGGDWVWYEDYEEEHQRLLTEIERLHASIEILDSMPHVERIRADERERIAQMVDEKQREWWRQYKDAEDPWSYLDEHYADAAKEIADAIRSMK